MLSQLKSWMKLNPIKHINDNCDQSSFTTPSTRIAVAVDETGKAISYTVVEKMLLTSAFAVNPKITPGEGRLAGDAIDKEMEQQAALEGISKAFVMVPAGFPLQEDAYTREVKNVRVFIRSIPQTTIAQGTWGQHNNTSATRLV